MCKNCYLCLEWRKKLIEYREISGNYIKDTEPLFITYFSTSNTFCYWNWPPIWAATFLELYRNLKLHLLFCYIDSGCRHRRQPLHFSLVDCRLRFSSHPHYISITQILQHRFLHSSFFCWNFDIHLQSGIGFVFKL